MIKFVSKFATQNYDGSAEAPAAAAAAAPAISKQKRKELNELRDSFTLSLIRYLLQRICAKDKAIRFRCCQLIGCILSELGPDAEVDESVFDDIRSALITRLSDTHATVRAMACAAATRLQEADSSQCAVTAEYVRLIHTDSNKDVRRAAVQYMGVTPSTLPHLMRCLRDVQPSVSAKAFELIGEKVPISILTIAQRIEVLRIGLNDRYDTDSSVCCAAVSCSDEQNNSDLTNDCDWCG